MIMTFFPFLGKMSLFVLYTNNDILIICKLSILLNCILTILITITKGYKYTKINCHHIDDVRESEQTCAVVSKNTKFYWS